MCGVSCKAVLMGDQVDQRQFDELLRRALATPPISNKEIERRSKEARSKPR
jgi:hypothetical protein